MELKVWVEGIQRVVCGITEQTTVQEVVIALAQATGRTGRYTLVEKWRDNEKLLPPTEHPIKVLEKWGEYASDVHFLLKRTGASTSSSDVEMTKVPERNVYRQSLPPLAKNREKSEMLQQLKRKEPKRKSLTITGGVTSQQNANDGKEKKSQNSNGNNNRSHEEVTARYDRSTSGSVPANVRKAAERFSANVSSGDSSNPSSKGGKSKDKSRSKHKPDKKAKEEPKSTKTALIPPHMQNQKSSVSSATEALFPSESKNEVAAKSPIRKNADNQIKNVNLKSGGKVPLMPPTHKVLRSRNSSSTDQQQPPQSSTNLPSSNHGRNLTSGSLTPAPFSLPNENKMVNYAYRYGNSLPRSKKKAWAEGNSASVDDKRLSRDMTKKTALLPPTQRQRAMTPNPQIHREAFRTSTSDGFSPLSPVPATRKSSSEQMKARDDFTKLVREQQRHIEEQGDTVAALDKEIIHILDRMQRKKMDIDAEIAQLEDQNRSLELQYEREHSVTEELSAEDSKGTSTRREMNSLQGGIDRCSADLTAYKRKMDDLSKAISEEAQLQRAKQQRQAETNRNLTMRNRKEMEQVNWTLSSLEEEIKRIEKEIAIRDEEISDKYSSLDSLNRELRQVNLQQFIRKTGSKVTVLPPETGSPDSRGSQSPGNIFESNPALNMSGSRSALAPPPTPRANSEGVWV